MNSLEAQEKLMIASDMLKEVINDFSVITKKSASDNPNYKNLLKAEALIADAFGAFAECD